MGEWIHDRYLYLPVFGFCVLLVYAISQLPSERELFGMQQYHGRGAVVSSHDGPGNVVGRAVLVQRLCLISTRGSDAFQQCAQQSSLCDRTVRRGEVAKSQALYEDALRMDPTDRKHNVAYGLLLYYSGQFEKADRQFEKAIALDPTDANPHFYQRISRFQLGDFSGAQNAFQQTIKASPGRSRYHFWLGFALEKQGKVDRRDRSTKRN